MDERSGRKKRYIAVAAATCVSLACGTNYAYSAWAPQFAEKLLLTATESNLVGTSANIGMYAMGIPFGYMVDKRGPHMNTALGAFLIAGGYYPLRAAYQSGPGSMSVFLLCFFSFLTGCGSCSAFQAAIKTSALNWPNHRGTATAFPLAAFGLSAFFFTSLSSVLFADSTSSYLLLLVVGSFCMVFFPVFFITTPRAETYQSLANEENDSDSRNSAVMHRPSNWRAKLKNGAISPSKASNTDLTQSAAMNPDGATADEVSSLLSNESIPGDIAPQEPESRQNSLHSHHSHKSDITGLQLLKEMEFYLLFLMLGVFTGIGLMTINNIGNDSNALWRKFDPTMSRDYITRRQLMHVSIISCTSFVGRLASGVGSDVLVKRLRLSRFWCMVVASCIFTLAQIIAITVSNPYYLWLLSTVGGLGYGVLFGVYPALVADAFGVSGLSLNWGFMTIAPVIWGNIFNIWYGVVYDAHSEKLETGERVCYQGLDCYRNAYIFSAICSVAGIGVSLWVVYWDNRKRERARLMAHGD